ncbi:hypothetical protein [Armatimonas sp.]|uniref:hypothetical protein n=1 Tax=Armatimonas sp. TaxID=1872638 RepID=UPI003750E71F
MNTSKLPVCAVTLFSSGVAYTQREGTIDSGEATVPLTFRTNQINDILKSLVLLDEEGGALPAIYPSQDPVERTLQSFAVDVSAFSTRGELLRQLRGVVLKIETISKEAFEGQIVAVESEKQVRGERSVVDVETLTLITAEGLVSVSLDKVRTIKLLDERRDAELREALTVLAGGADDARRTVQLRFAGKKKRKVQVGYITEAPLWKISYRLVLSDTEGQKPYIQGWALVENTTDEDWEGVQLTLVSGRPISFIQDLYQPLYLPRPTVGPDIIPAAVPQVHEGVMSPFESGGAVAMMAAPAPMAKRSLRAESMRQSVVSQAEGRSAGELFQYNIKAPVALPRQQAAMIPVVSGDIGGEKISLYNADTDPKYPMNAIKLVNDTGLHLKAGPITVFDGGTYAGDARLGEVPPSDTRLITYAVDLSIEGVRTDELRNGNELSLTIKRGVLTITSKNRRETLYKFTSKAAAPRTVLVEHPLWEGWTLVAPTEPTETTRDRYRFAVSIAPGASASLSVAQEQALGTTVVLLEADTAQLTHYASSGELPSRLKEALAVTIARRRKIHELETNADLLDRERTQIHEEQGRIRGNLAALDKESPLYHRYLDELNGQENRLLELREEGNRLRKNAHDAQAELKAFLDTLDL